MNAIFTYNFANKTIIGSKSAINRANKGINPEYRVLTAMLEAHPTFNVVEKTIKKSENKKTYGGLTIETMKSYISTLDDSKSKLIEFNAIIMVAEAKGAKYPLTKKWFLKTYPEFKSNNVEASESAKKQVEEAMRAKAMAMATEALNNLSDDEDEFDEAC